jgi:Putative GTPase activating protein for Arf
MTSYTTTNNYAINDDEASGVSFRLPDAWANSENSLVEYRERIAHILEMPCHETCADCGASNPQWSSLLLSEGRVDGLGAVICQDCALVHHEELGEQRCFIKFLQYFHEWTHTELDILDHCGNDLVNEVYEARLGREERRLEKSRSMSRFIRLKYKKCRWLDQQALQDARELVDVRATLAKASKNIQLDTCADTIGTGNSRAKGIQTNRRRSSSGSCNLSYSSDLTPSLFDDIAEDDEEYSQGGLDDDNNDYDYDLSSPFLRPEIDTHSLPVTFSYTIKQAPWTPTYCQNKPSMPGTGCLL